MVTVASERGPLEDHLGNAGDNNADSQAEDLLGEGGPQPGGQKEHARNHDHVKHGRAERRDEEMTTGVRHADEHGSYAGEHHVGEHEP